MASSRIPGFYKLPLSERHRLLSDKLELNGDEREALTRGGLERDTADKMVENVVGTFQLRGQSAGSQRPVAGPPARSVRSQATPRSVAQSAKRGRTAPRASAPAGRLTAEDMIPFDDQDAVLSEF